MQAKKKKKTKIDLHLPITIGNRFTQTHLFTFIRRHNHSIVQNENSFKYKTSKLNQLVGSIHLFHISI